MSRLSARFSRMMQLCRRRGRSREEAEDLIQDALLRLHEYCRQTVVRDEDAFLYRTVSNLAINRYRRERIVSFASETFDELEQTVGFPDLTPDPERIYAAQQHLDEIVRLLGSVSERTCQIFMAQRAGYSYEEIAADWGISARSVQKHVARAMFLLIGHRMERGDRNDLTAVE